MQCAGSKSLLSGVRI